MPVPTCIHAAVGLCPACAEEYETDPAAWLEFGQHTQGIAAWEALQAEIAADQAAEGPPAETDPSIPF